MKAFSSFHPVVLMTYFVCIVAVTMVTMNPVLLVLSIMGSLLFTGALEGIIPALKSLGFYIPTFILIMLINPLVSHNGVTPLFFMNGNPVTLEAVLYGCASAVLLVGIFYWCRCYNKVMTSDKFIYLFGRVIPKLSLVISMALKFIPTFKRQVRKISDAQKTLGIYATESIADRIQSALRVFFATVVWALENAADTSVSMNARGYGMKGRTSFSLYIFKKRDLFVLAILIALTILIFTGHTDFSFYPEISPIPITSASYMSYAAMGLLAFLPFIIELKEELRWKYLISKI